MCKLKFDWEKILFCKLLLINVNNYEFFVLQWQADYKIIVPGKVSVLTISSNGSYCVAAIDKDIHIWEVMNFKIIL